MTGSTVLLDIFSSCLTTTLARTNKSKAVFQKEYKDNLYYLFSVFFMECFLHLLELCATDARYMTNLVVLFQTMDHSPESQIPTILVIIWTITIIMVTYTQENLSGWYKPLLSRLLWEHCHCVGLLPIQFLRICATTNCIAKKSIHTLFLSR